MGFRTERCRTPVLGCWRTGDAKLYTIRSTWPMSFFIRSMVCCFISSENASPLILLAYNPSAWANCSNAAELYQPGEAVFPSDGAFSKNTPIVAAPDPNALAMREDSPNPVEAPITSTCLAALIGPFDFT